MLDDLDQSPGGSRIPRWHNRHNLNRCFLAMSLRMLGDGVGLIAGLSFGHGYRAGGPGHAGTSVTAGSAPLPMITIRSSWQTCSPVSKRLISTSQRAVLGDGVRAGGRFLVLPRLELIAERAGRSRIELLDTGFQRSRMSWPAALSLG